MGLLVRNVLDDILLLWGVESASMGREVLRERAVSDLNAALQLIWSKAKELDYFNRATLTQTFSIGSGMMTLEQAVQNVLGPVRTAAKQPLRLISNRSQFDNYGTLFLGQLSDSVAGGIPQAYFVERLNQADPDNVKVNLYIVPAPLVSTDILIDVALECPRYTWSDYCDDTALQMPHQYAELLLLPICRFWASTFNYFTREEKRPSINAAYQTAALTLGMVDPLPKEATASKEAA